MRGVAGVGDFVMTDEEEAGAIRRAQKMSRDREWVAGIYGGDVGAGGSGVGRSGAQPSWVIEESEEEREEERRDVKGKGKKRRQVRFEEGSEE